MTISDDSRKLVTVFGATGNQGGSVVRSLLQNKDFRVRAITRNPGSPCAQGLQDLGATLVRADGWKRDEMVAAFQGSWAAFVNINSDDPIFRDGHHTEYDMGKNIIDGMIAAGVQHALISCFITAKEFARREDATFLTMDEKNRIEKYAVASGRFRTVIPIHTSTFYHIFQMPILVQAMGGFPDHEDEDGYLTIRMPGWGIRETDIPWVDLSVDYGDIVHGVLLNPEEHHQKPVSIISDHVSWDGIAEAFEKATGKKARYIPIEAAEWALGIPALDGYRQFFTLLKEADGHHFAHEELNNTKIAAELKKHAAKAQGKDESKARLMPAEEWFRRHF